jgi:hypothetical protein
MINLSSFSNFFHSIASKHTRKVTDVNPHFVPLDLKVLDTTLGSIIDNTRPVILEGSPAQPQRIDLKKLRNKIISFITSAYPNKIILSGNQIIVNGKPELPIDTIIRTKTPAVVYLGSASNSNIIGILFSSFNRSEAEFFDDFLNNEIIAFAKDTLGVAFTQFDAGIVLQNDASPITKKVSTLSRILNSFSSHKTDLGLGTAGDQASVFKTRAIVNSLLQEYSRIHPVGPVVNANISKTVSGFISKVNADIVIIQDASASQALEKEFTSSAVVNKIGQMAADTKIKGGTTLLQDIASRILNVFGFGKKKATRPKAEKARIKTVDLRKSSKVKTTGIRGGTTVVKFPPPKVPLSSLQTIINSSLAEKIRSNMGKGDSIDVLNYRTGRLANSAKVEAISLGRSGAINAFFSYMRHPYGTFAEGGKKQDPRSRDPVMLIGKSIRQLATENAVSELRTTVI